MPGNSKERNVVLNFKMDGQVQYANTLKQINMVMNNAAKEYKNHIAAMGQDATMTDKLLAEKKKLEIQMEAAKKRTAMLRSEYQAMSKDTSTTAEQLNKMYGKLLDAERAETSLDNAMKRVNEGLSEQAIEAREARGTLLDLQENSKKLEAGQKRLTSSFKLQNAELGQNASEADKLELAQKQLRQQMEMTDRVVHNLEQQLSAAKRVYGENSTEVQQLEAKLNQAKTTLKQFENSLQSVGRSGSQAADGMAEISKKLDMNNLMEAAEVLQGISEKLIEMGKSIVNTAIEFDGSQRKIQASLGLTGKGAENLQKIAVDTWKKGFGENLEEVDNALIKVYQNMRDVPYDELQMASEDVLTLAKIYDVDLNEATRGAGQLMSQFGLSTQETFDLLAAGAQEGLNYSDELFDNLSEYAPLFKQGGFSAQEMFTILANGTKSGSYNLDYINDLVKEFGIRVQDGSKGVSEGFGDLSEETQKVWKSFNEGKGTAADVFNAVLGDLQKMDDKVKANQIGVALFGVKWEDMGAEAVLSLNNVHGGLGDVTGRMDEMKKLQEESLGQQFQKALRETQAALEPLGKKFAELAKDILPPIVDGVKAVMDWFSKLSEADQTLLIVMGALSAAFIILTPIVAALAVSFGALNLAFLPVIATIAAVSLVITGIIMLIKNWGAITDWLSEKWSQFKDWFGELWSGIVQACSDGWSATVDYFSGAWSDFLNMVNEFFEPIGQFFTDLWTGIVETATSIWDQLKTAWQETWNTIVTVLDPIISLISTVLEAGWLLIQAGAQIAWAAISQYIIQPIQEAYDWVSKQIGELVDWLGTQWEIAKAVAQVAWGLFKQYIVQPVQEAWSTTKEKFSDLISWLSSQWETAKSYTLSAWNLIKQYVIQPVQELWNATKEKLNDLANWILGNWAKIQSYTLTAWNLVYKYIIDPVISAYNSAKEKFNDMYNTAREKFDSVKNAAQEKFDAAKRFIIDPIKDAVDKVKGFIDKIKGFFSDLKLKIPKPEMPKMPHFSLETSTKNILGKDITYPSGIGVQWRAKGGIFTRPTIFGMSNGQLQGAGEAGNEAVLPLNKKTLGAIGEGIAATMSTEPTVINIYNPSVREDRDIDRMVGKIDDALAQKGRNSKIGIGRTT
ncbi:phage tail tape measure protein [Bacillus thuringiensis]|uniref:phage tail tape measure protein n=1 Tax=Bacillus thuringiensis TaxID=1428 RepID=UPI0005AF2E29|nr:phage tail tape measure protein [Bacillus thuringiensis]MCU5278094.1 phage tail tape measure protein [Bacillus cereus]AMR87311.1 phage tail tape measure protein [Bacillus thuringiensis]KIP28040.1 phage tail tape measure protein, TP901 family, core region [Bacillus thuringiensis serovar morrisoni]MBG9640689.1 phage tail tape measure protein, TP901 family, core region [Bacillus thuringiensis]MEC3269968.1 phage tail tape measure protein [Bacillus thuringiensis]